MNLPITIRALPWMLAIAVGTAAAQCPDGSPPPCRGARSAAVRRIDPPLDADKWMIVPFDNLSNAADVEWLRDASVISLYQDLSRWQDIRVVDDERVRDLVRNALALQGEKAVPRTLALAFAKRMGAGKLVMGDIIKNGGAGTSLTAKLYDVKTGDRMRTAQQNAIAPDSLLPAFGRLARDIINLPRPEGLSVSFAGTSRIDAAQEYVAGVKALNKFILPEAQRHFERAVALDPTFALAHYKLIQSLGWGGWNDPRLRTSGEASVRFSAALPARERSLIAANAALGRSDFYAACVIYSGLVRTDSLDTEATLGFGDCSHHDPTVVRIPGDTTRFRFVHDWNESNRAFERVLAQDPTNHVAFQHIIETHYQYAQRNGCFRPVDASARCDPSGPRLLAPLRLVGDSLVTEPVLVTDTAAIRTQLADRARTGARRRLLDTGRRLAQSWVDAGPDEPQGHGMLAILATQQGDTRVADLEFAKATGLYGGNFGETTRYRIDLMLRMGRGGELNRMADSLASTREWSGIAAEFGQAAGRFRAADSLNAAGGARAQAPPQMIEMRRQMPRLTAGVGGDSALATERSWLQFVGSRPGITPQLRSAAPTLLLGLRLPRASWPVIDYGSNDRRADLVVAVSKGDTARVRADARALDSIAKAAVRATDPDSGWAIVAADGYLVLRDSAAAITSLRILLDQAVVHTPATTPVPNGDGAWVGLLWPRAMLLRADLAAGLGLKDEARTWYGTFLELWSKADPEFAPIVARARAAYTSLGGK